MSKYTTTREGFQRAMEWALNGPPEEAKAYCEGTSTPDFEHFLNGKRTGMSEYIKVIAEWRGKVSDYKPKVEEFLRDGDQLAARMVGTIKVEGEENAFESFLFGKVDKKSGKLEQLVERQVWGPVGAPPVHGVN